MLRIKLARKGKKKQPFYRILVMERAKDPWGDFLENVGTYNPLTNPSTVQLNEERIKYWLSVGAQPTDTVYNILVGAGIIKGKKKAVSRLGKKAKEAVAKAEGEKREKSDQKSVTSDQGEEKKEEKIVDSGKEEKKDSDEGSVKSDEGEEKEEKIVDSGKGEKKDSDEGSVMSDEVEENKEEDKPAEDKPNDAASARRESEDKPVEDTPKEEKKEETKPEDKPTEDKPAEEKANE